MTHEEYVRMVFGHLPIAPAPRVESREVRVPTAAYSVDRGRTWRPAVLESDYWGEPGGPRVLTRIQNAGGVGFECRLRPTLTPITE